MKSKENLVDSITISIAALLLSIFVYGLQGKALALLVLFVSFSGLAVFLRMLIARRGMILLFAMIVGAILFFLDALEIGIVGIVLFVISGIMFELMTIFVKGEKGVVLGGIAATTVIPITMLLLLSPRSFSGAFLLSILNLTLWGILIGTAGALLGIFVWYQLRARKYIIQYAIMRR